MLNFSDKETIQYKYNYEEGKILLFDNHGNEIDLSTLTFEQIQQITVDLGDIFSNHMSLIESDVRKCDKSVLRLHLSSSVLRFFGKKQNFNYFLVEQMAAVRQQEAFLYDMAADCIQYCHDHPRIDRLQELADLLYQVGGIEQNRQHFIDSSISYLRESKQYSPAQHSDEKAYSFNSVDAIAKVADRVKSLTIYEDTRNYLAKGYQNN